MLNVVSKEEAAAYVLRQASGIGMKTENVPLFSAVGRTLAADLTSA